MDIFFFWNESQGMVELHAPPRSKKKVLFFGWKVLAVWVFVVLMSGMCIFRRDSRKAVYLQHGVFDSSMG